MKEEWREVEGYEGMYEVSNKARIRRGKIRSNIRKAGAIINTRVDHYGYLVVDLWKERKQKRPRVHRLMMIAFKGSPENGQEGRHLNDIKLDNRLDNLVWGTRSDNNYDFYKNGGVKGFNNPKVLRKALETRGVLC